MGWREITASVPTSPTPKDNNLAEPALTQEKSVSVSPPKCAPKAPSDRSPGLTGRIDGAEPANQALEGLLAMVERAQADAKGREGRRTNRT